MKKIYPVDFYVSSDKELISRTKLLSDHVNENETEFYQASHKLLNNLVRESINSKNIVQLMLRADLSEMIISVFDIEATDSNFYEAKFDEELYLPYIEVEEQ